MPATVPLYGEMLQLKAKPEENHRWIAERALKYVKQLPKLKSHEQNIDWVIYRHTTTLDLKQKSPKVELSIDTQSSIVQHIASQHEKSKKENKFHKLF